MNLAQALARLEILKQSGREDQVRRLQIRIQQRFAIPFACIAFAIVGSALGTTPNAPALPEALALASSLFLAITY